MLATLANHSLPFTKAPVLLDLARELAKDPKALTSNSMDRTTASYKMRFGMAQTIHTNTVASMKSGYFSLNIDESTSNNLNRVLAVLVSFYSPTQKEVVVQHLKSISVVSVSAESLLQELVNIFSENEIPWENLMSVLMDSCAVMRGSKSGLEVRLRSEKAPHLLDIDGDSCHHVHNAAQKFLKPFEFWVERLHTDVHTDFKWSVDLRDALANICELIGLKFTMPERFVNHRWLSVYDVTLSNNRLMDGLKVFYYAFLCKDDKPLYHAHIIQIYHRRQVSKEAQSEIRSIQRKLSDKIMTEDGKTRKKRIIERLFYKSKKTKLIMNFIIASMPMLKEYVCLFEMKSPLIHLLHEKQFTLFKGFLSCFMKAEKIKDLKPHHDSSIIDDSSSRVAKRDIFIGSTAKGIVSAAHKSDSTVNEFLEQVESAYVMCSKYLSRKLPLDNKVLLSISAIDPSAHGHSITTKHLLQLPKLVTNVLTQEEIDPYDLQVRKYQVDSFLPAYSQDVRIDHWWSEDHLINSYPLLCKMVHAVLSCFHGPQVEGSFNIMGDILDPKSCRMEIHTLSAVQTVAYHMRSTKKTPLEYFRRDSVLHSPVDPLLMRNMKGAYHHYKNELLTKRKARMDKEVSLALPGTSGQTKRKSKEEAEQEQKRARLDHMQRQEDLALKRKKKKERTDRLLALAKKLKNKRK